MKKLLSNSAILINGPIDSELYILHYKACSLLKVGYKNKTRISEFIQAYTDGELIYYLRTDIQSLKEWREKLDIISTLKSVLNLQDNKAVFAFFVRNSIRLLEIGEHPFGDRYLFYKSDLDIIKSLRIEDVKSINEHNQNIANDYYKKSYPVSIDIEGVTYLGLAHIIRLLKIERYSPYLKKLQSKQVNGFLYYKKSDINDIIILKENTTSINDLRQKMTSFGDSMTRKDIEKLGFKVFKENDHPFGKKNLVYTSDIDKIKDAYLKNIPSDFYEKGKYVSKSEADSILGKKLPPERLRMVINSFTFKQRTYYIKDDIMNLRFLYDNSLRYSVFIKNCKFNDKQITSTIKKLKIQLFSTSQHPFHDGFRIMKSDAELLMSHLEAEDKYKTEKNVYNKYRLLIQDIPEPKLNISKTIHIFNTEFVITRFGVKRKFSLAKTMFDVLMAFESLLSKELELYNQDEFNLLVEGIFGQRELTSEAKTEAIYFCNFIIDKKKLLNVSNFKVVRSLIKEKDKTKTAYSENQFLALFSILYSNVNNYTYIEKAINSRLLTMTWLYMLLHFVVFWRASTIRKIPFPDLEVIGFSDENVFFDWISNPENKFTDDMNTKIILSVKSKIDALNKKASKNEMKLVFEVGHLISKALAPLLAICEAHRRAIIESKTENSNLLITSSAGLLKYCEDLFGDDYINILGKNDFLNIKANKAFVNYTLNYSDKQNDGLGGHMLSIMRSHVVNVNGISNTTSGYDTRLVDESLSTIQATLIERGTFGFAKFQLLHYVDSNFSKLDSLEKTNTIKSLSLSPYEIELMLKEVKKQRSIVNGVIEKMLISDSFKLTELMLSITNSTSSAKHNNAKCFLKAILTASQFLKNEVSLDEFFSNFNESKLKFHKCLFPETISCIGCPMLIGESYFLLELSDIIGKVIQNLFKSESESELQVHSHVLFTGCFPILYEAIDVLGKDVVESFVPLENILSNIHLLEENKKILL